MPKGTICNRPIYNPTPEEIAKHCAKFRESWSTTERLGRLAKQPAPTTTWRSIEARATIALSERLARERAAD